MKNVKKVIAAIALIGVIGVSGAAYAAELKTPADIASVISGRSIAEVQAERAQGKTYGTIAKEAGKLDEFQAQMLEQKKAVLDQRVKEGRLTQQQADDMYNNMKNNTALCDGTGNMQAGQNCGAGFGKGAGVGMGRGLGMGNGLCRGTGSNQ